MAERVDMSFKNKEVRMWFVIMIPAFIIGAIALALNDSSTQYLHFIVLLIALVTYYTWRFRYRKKKKENGSEQ